jgi:hypothetical protein
MEGLDLEFGIPSTVQILFLKNISMSVLGEEKPNESLIPAIKYSS